MLRLFSFVLLTIYTISMIYPDLERYIFNNEFFALFGFISLFILFVYNKISLRRINWFLLFLVYGLMLFVLSIEQIVDTGIYLSLRTMTLWYSSFSFFAGYLCIRVIGLDFIIINLKRFRKFSWVSLFISGARLSPQSIYSFGVKNSTRSLFVFTIFGLAFFVIKPGSTTITALIFGVGLFLWSNLDFVKKMVSKKLIVIFSVVLLLSLYWFIPVFERFLIVGYGELSNDNNATWRLMFWVYLFKEKFMLNPFFGLGFGTKLFDLSTVPSFITSDDGTRNTEYTLGTHNSFFYTAIRMGGVGFLLLILSHVKIYSFAVACYKSLTCSLEKNILFSIVLANLLFLNSALFNVILESPLYASNYWFSLGLMVSFCTSLNSKEIR